MDGGTGVLETRYALDGSTTSIVFSSTFSLAGGTHTLSFRSQDRAGNLEAFLPELYRRAHEGRRRRRPSSNEPPAF